jgi:hypothetical protein
VEGNGLDDGTHPLMWHRGKARGGAFRVSLLPGFACRFDGCVSMGGSNGGVIGMKFSFVA